MLDKEKKSRNEVFINRENNINILHNPLLKNINSRLFAFADNYIVSFNKNAGIKWSLPILGRPHTVQTGDELALVFSDSILFLDIETGQPASKYVSEGIIWNAYEVNKILHIDEYHPEIKRNIIKTYSNGEISILGSVDRYSTSLTIMDEDTAFANYKGSLSILKKNEKGDYIPPKDKYRSKLKKPKKSKLKKKNEDPAEYKKRRDEERREWQKKVKEWQNEYKKIQKDRSRNRISIMNMERISPDAYVALGRKKNRYTCLFLFREGPGKEFKRLEWEYDRSKLKINSQTIEDMELSEKMQFQPESDLLAFKLFDLQKEYNIVLLKDMEDITDELKFRTRPLVRNSLIFGISSKTMVQGSTNAEFIIYDIKKKKIISTRPLGESLFPAERSLSISIDNDLYFFFQRPHGMKAVKYDPETEDLEIMPFPGFNGKTLFLYNNRIILTDNNEVIILTMDEFKGLFKIQNNQQKVSESPDFKYEIDGYPDEWDLNDFNKTGENSFNAKITGRYLILSCMIRDQEIIKQISIKDEKKRIKFILLPNHLASFGIKNISKQYILNFMIDRKWNYDYSVFPTGERCFIEMKIPIESLFNNEEEAKDPYRSLAFNIMYSDGQGNRSVLFNASGCHSGQIFPAAFPKINWKSSIR